MPTPQIVDVYLWSKVPGLILIAGAEYMPCPEEDCFGLKSVELEIVTPKTADLDSPLMVDVLRGGDGMLWTVKGDVIGDRGPVAVTSVRREIIEESNGATWAQYRLTARSIGPFQTSTPFVKVRSAVGW